MERTQWKLPHGPYTMEVTSWTVHNGTLQVERTPWKLPHGTYPLCMVYEGTSIV